MDSKRTAHLYNDNVRLKLMEEDNKRDHDHVIEDRNDDVTEAVDQVSVTERLDDVTKSIVEVRARTKLLEYTLTERPPVLVILGAALQHVLTCTPVALALPYIIGDTICACPDSPVRSTLVCTTFLMVGICTVIQTALGVRLPILQGPANIFVSVYISIQTQQGWVCPQQNKGNTTNDMFKNDSFHLDDELSFSQNEKLQKLSGSLMAASLVEILIGGTGLVGFLPRFVGPITVAPVLSLLGLSLVKVPLRYGASSWILTVVGIALIVAISLYLGHLQVRAPASNCCPSSRKKRFSAPIFRLLPVLMGMIVMWLVCWILTHFNVFPDDETHPNYRARTDAKSHLTQRAPWFYLPYPGQFGMPSFDITVFIGFVVSFIASIIESVGDYFAAAKACEVSSPPPHAVNRGILVEGVGGLLSGIFGLGHATTTYSGNIAEITLTKTANRYVMYCAGLILVLVSVLGKFGAALASIPDPVLAGAVSVMFGMLVALGLSTLQYVDLNSARNLLILGTAFFAGSLFPQWILANPDLINTGSREGDNILKLLFGTPMLLGGLIAILLDNTVRGSRRERGLDGWQKNEVGERHEEGGDAGSGQTGSKNGFSNVHGDPTYTWLCIHRLYHRLSVCSRLPFMPPYDGNHLDLN